MIIVRLLPDGSVVVEAAGYKIGDDTCIRASSPYRTALGGNQEHKMKTEDKVSTTTQTTQLDILES